VVLAAEASHGVAGTAQPLLAVQTRAVEMFTTANQLTAGGQDRMNVICIPGNAAKWTRVSAHDASWDHVALPNAMEVTRAVFRAAIRPENYERNQVGQTIALHGLSSLVKTTAA
jgi:hypothetical protein